MWEYPTYLLFLRHGDTLTVAVVQVYQTSQGYFVVTPERRRRDSSGHQRRHSRTAVREDARSMLMSTEEALAYVHGEMQTIRDGAVTHQALQTNLADVICGGESLASSRDVRLHSLSCCQFIID
jgi:hypothetical protein